MCVCVCIWVLTLMSHGHRWRPGGQNYHCHCDWGLCEKTAQTNIRKGKREKALHFIGYGCEAVTWSHVWILIFWQDFDLLALTNVSFTLHPMLRLTLFALTCACAPDSRRPWRRRRGHSAARSGGNTCRETDAVRHIMFEFLENFETQTPSNSSFKPFSS